MKTFTQNSIMIIFRVKLSDFVHNKLCIAFDIREITLTQRIYYEISREFRVSTCCVNSKKKY